MNFDRSVKLNAKYDELKEGNCNLREQIAANAEDVDEEELYMMKERLNELLKENTSLEEQVTDKENGLKRLQSEVERFEKELQLQGVDIDVGYKPRVLCDPHFIWIILLTGQSSPD